MVEEGEPAGQIDFVIGLGNALQYCTEPALAQRQSLLGFPLSFMEVNEREQVVTAIPGDHPCGDFDAKEGPVLYAKAGLKPFDATLGS